MPTVYVAPMEESGPGVRVMFILRNNPYRMFRWEDTFPAVFDIADTGLLFVNGEEVTETTVTLEHGDRFQWFPGDVY